MEEDRFNFVEIEKMPSREAFQVMEDFAETTPLALKGLLFTALSKRKPFAHFKDVVDNSGEWRLRWFDFQYRRYQEWVKEQVEWALRQHNPEEE